jgi:hypothetical protein
MQERRAYYAAPASPLDSQRYEERIRRELAGTLHAVLGADPPGNISIEVCEGNAERVLTDVSVGADLLVLGSASHCPAAPPAGPVIRTCLSRAQCPVVVVSPEAVPDSGRGARQPARTSFPVVVRRERSPRRTASQAPDVVLVADNDFQCAAVSTTGEGVVGLVEVVETELMRDELADVQLARAKQAQQHRR